MMPRNIVAGGMVACGAGCVALAAVPGFSTVACALGGGVAAAGLLLWKPKPTEVPA